MIHDVSNSDPAELAALYVAGGCGPMRQPPSSPASMPGIVCSPKRSPRMKESSPLSRRGRSRLSPTPRARERLFERVAGTRPGKAQQASDNDRIAELTLGDCHPHG